MTRVIVVVEGPTERRFIQEVLAPELWNVQVSVTAALLGKPGHKGGNTNYARLRADIVRLLRQDDQVYCSTMLDLYGLGKGLPGDAASAGPPRSSEGQTSGAGNGA